MATIKFNDFAERYCGTNDRAEQFQILMDAFTTVNDDEWITWEQLRELFDKEVQIEQSYFEPNDYYDIIINNTYACMSLEKMI